MLVRLNELHWLRRCCIWGDSEFHLIDLHRPLVWERCFGEPTDSFGDAMEENSEEVQATNSFNSIVRLYLIHQHSLLLP